MKNIRGNFNSKLLSLEIRNMLCILNIELIYYLYFYTLRR